MRHISIDADVLGSSLVRAATGLGMGGQDMAMAYGRGCAAAMGPIPACDGPGAFLGLRPRSRTRANPRPNACLDFCLTADLWGGIIIEVGTCSDLLVESKPPRIVTRVMERR